MNGGTPAASNGSYTTTAPIQSGGDAGGGYTGGDRGNGLESFAVRLDAY